MICWKSDMYLLCLLLQQVLVARIIRLPGFEAARVYWALMPGSFLIKLAPIPVYAF